MGRFFFKHRNDVENVQQLFIGSVKTNIGHTESAAGVAGLIKTLLMMRHGQIVPSLHINPDMSNLNPKIKLMDNGIQVATDVQEWKPNEYDNRIGCVNSFGFGGTNCHCILLQRQSYTSCITKDRSNAIEEQYFVVVSAESPERLKSTVEKLRQDLRDTTENMSTISYTSTCLRDHLSYRVGYAVSSLQELTQKVAETSVTDKHPTKKRNLVFVFGGTGTTWTGMCSELIFKDEFFRKGIEKVDTYLELLTGISIVNKFEDPHCEYTDPFLNHIALFAVQVGLTEMLQGFGIVPDSVIGQSVGEVAAAYASGSLDLKSAVDVIYYRSKYLTQCTGGTMMVVKNLDVNEMKDLCEKYDRKVTVAVYLSPIACTLSGEIDTMEKIKEDIQKIKMERHIEVFLKEMPFHYAYHSHKVESCLSAVRTSIKALQSGARQTLVLSTVTGKTATKEDFQTGDYWVNNIRQPVQVNKAILSAAHEDKKNIFIEIGPHPFVGAHIADIFKTFKVQYICVSSMRKHQELRSRNATLIELFENGFNIHWKRDLQPAQPSTIPKYVFKRKKILFLPDDVKKQFREGISSSIENDHMFIQNSSKDDAAFKLTIGKQTTPFVFDHFMREKVLVPAAAYVESAFAIAHKKLNATVEDVEISLEFVNTFYPKDDCDSYIDCEVDESSEGTEIKFSHENRTLCTAKAEKKQHYVSKHVSIESVQDKCTVLLSSEEVYACLAKFGYKYGSSLSLIKQAWCTETECLAELNLPEPVVNEVNKTHIHPAVLDSMFQLPGVLNNSLITANPVLPKRIKSVRSSGKPGQRLFCYAVSTGMFHGQAHVNALLLDVNGNSLCEIRDFIAKEVEIDHTLDKIAYTLDWCPLFINRKEKGLCTSTKSILWCTETARKIIEPLCTGLKPKFYIFGSDCEIEECQLNDAVEETKSGLYQSVIFAPFFDVDLDTTTGDAVYRLSKRTILGLKRILLALNRKSIGIPLFVITKNTQCSMKQPKVVSSICGSELWGFARSAIHENGYPAIRLLDIDEEECDKEMFVEIIGNRFPDETELRLESHHVLVNRLQPHSHFLLKNIKKTVHLQDSDEACLRSTIPSKLTSPFFRKCKTNRSAMSSSNDTITIRLTSISLHHEDIYPVTRASGDEMYNIWPELSVDGFQTVCTEGIGVDESRSEKDVKYFIFPTSVATHVTIPSFFVFDPSDVQSYIPGLLTTSCVLMYLHNKVKTSAGLCICTDDENTHSLQLLQAHRGNKGIFVMQTSDIVKRSLDLNDNVVNETQSVMILCKLKRTDIEYLMTVLPHVKKITTLSQFIPERIRRWVFFTFPEIEVSSPRAENIFQRTKLEKLMPDIRDLLAHQNFIWNKEMPTGKEKKTPFSLPCKEISLSDYSSKYSVSVEDTKIFNGNCCYIVVGGLTGLGWIVMEWIAKMGGGYIRSISRRKPSGDQLREIQRLAEDTMSNIEAISADITDLSALRDVINNLQEKLNDIPIKGVFNGAGALADCLLINLSEEKLEKVILPKIQGAINLHIATKELDLDFFVMHSSIVSVLGNRGQTSYGAGNSFIDSLAHYRRSRNMCALSINWGPLNDIGMLENKPELRTKLSEKGFNSISKEDICVCLKQAVLSDSAQITIGSFNWPLLGANKALSKLKNLVPGHLTAKHHSVSGSEKVYIFDVNKYRQATEEEKFSLLFEVVVHVLRHVFIINDKSILCPEFRIYELGLDSFTASNFVHKLHHYTNFNIPFEVMLSDDTTIQTIVTLLEQNIGRPSSTIREGELDPNSSLSFPELSALLEFEGNPENEKSVEVIDMKFKGITWNLETWRHVLNHLVWMNPGLCRHYLRNGCEFEVENLRVNDADVDVCLMSDEEIHEDDPRDYIHFDVSSELPIKFRIGQGTSNTLLRIIFHPVVADLSTQLIICTDLRNIGLARIHKKELPERKGYVGVARILHTKVNQMSNNARDFWRQQLRAVTKPLTLRSDTGSDDLERSHFKLTKGTFTGRMRDNIFDFCKSEKVTPFQFICSVYQMLLYMVSSEELVSIPVVAPVDLRIHSEELKGCVGRCINDIPLIAVFEKKQTFHEFLHSNADRIRQSISHSAYPYSMIIQELPLKTMQENIGRHRLCEDNITGFGQPYVVGDITTSLKNSWTVSDQYETYLGYTVDLDTRMMSYELGCNTLSCGSDKSERMLSSLMNLLKKCIDRPNEEVRTLANITLEKTSK